MFLDKAGFDKIAKALPRLKTVSVSTVASTFKVNGSLARRLIAHFLAQGKLKSFGTRHAKQYCYTGVDFGKKAPKAEGDKKKKGGKKKKNK